MIFLLNKSAKKSKGKKRRINNIQAVLENSKRVLAEIVLNSKLRQVSPCVIVILELVKKVNQNEENLMKLKKKLVPF